MDLDLISRDLLNRLPLLLALAGAAACAEPEHGDGEAEGATEADTDVPAEGPDDDDSPADSTDGDDDDDDDDGADGSSDGASEETGASGVCGDGVVDLDEACDDGINDGSYGGCEPGCGVRAPHCGDGTVDPQEVCDDGINDGAYGGCESGCQALAGFCGDAVHDPEESCDDGNDAINDGCNPDCSAPGETLWSTTWHNPDLFEDAIDWSYPAGLVLTSADEGQLAVGEALNNGEDQVSNLVLDLADGSVTAVTTYPAAGGVGYRAYATAPRAGGMVVAGSTIDLVEGGADPVMYLLDEAGTFTGSYDVLGDTPVWTRAAGLPTSSEFAVGNNQLVLAYEGSEVQYQFAPPAFILEPRAIAYTADGLHVAGPNTTFAGLTIYRVEDDGGFGPNGFWSEPEGIGEARPLDMRPTTEGGLVLGGYFAVSGELDRRFLLKVSADLEVEWSVYPESAPTESQWRAVCSSPNGDVHALGRVGVAGGGWQDRVEKYTADGQLLWIRVLDEDEWAAERRVIACDDSGGSIVVGQSLHEVWYARLAP